MRPQELRLRRVVVALANCSAIDRDWILAQLREGERDTVVSLLDTLEGQPPAGSEAANDVGDLWAATTRTASNAATTAPDMQLIRERILALPIPLQVQAWAGAPAPIREKLAGSDVERDATSLDAMTPRAREALYEAVLACGQEAPDTIVQAPPRPAPRPWRRRWRP